MQPLEIFLSYSHEDEELRKKLEKQLDILRRQGLIKPWHDRRINPGDDWSGQINSNLQSADIILLLVSPDFLASDYINDVEIKHALERHKQGSVRVVPIILRPSFFRRSPLSALQALPTDAKPITEWSSLDAAMLNVAEGIASLVDEMTASIKAVEPVAEKNSTETENLSFDTLDVKIRKSILRVKYADITTQNADVLVSSDDVDVTMGGGVSLAIRRSAGPIIRKEVAELGRLRLGDVGVTSAGRLQANKIFHAAVLDYSHPRLTNMNLIRSVTRKCLQKMDDFGYSTIVFPALATGVARLSPERSAAAMLLEIAEHLRGKTTIREVVVVIYPRPGLQNKIIRRFYEQIRDFIETSARIERLNGSLVSLEESFRHLQSDESAQNVARARGHIESERQAWGEKFLNEEVEADRQYARHGYSTAIDDDLEDIASLRPVHRLHGSGTGEMRKADLDYIISRISVLREMIKVRNMNMTDIQRGTKQDKNQRLSEERIKLKYLEDELEALLRTEGLY